MKRIVSPSTKMPYMTRTFTRAVLPFCRGTERPHVEHVHFLLSSRASQSSMTVFCHGSRVMPKEAPNSYAWSPSVSIYSGAMCTFGS